LAQEFMLGFAQICATPTKIPPTPTTAPPKTRKLQWDELHENKKEVRGQG